MVVVGGRRGGLLENQPARTNDNLLLGWSAQAHGHMGAHTTPSNFGFSCAQLPAAREIGILLYTVHCTVGKYVKDLARFFFNAAWPITNILFCLLENPTNPTAINNFFVVNHEPNSL